MTTQLNHTIVYSSDRVKSARFLAEILGRPAPVRFGPFEVVELDNAVSLDFAAADGPIHPQHYAFLISEVDFDAVFGRIRAQGLQYWADPRRSRPGEINHNDGGRGVYFPDPDGHYLEVITRPYGSGQLDRETGTDKSDTENERPRTTHFWLPALVAILLIGRLGIGWVQESQWHDPSPHRVLSIEVAPDVKLEVLDWGGAGPAVVLLAGLGNTAHIFDNFAPKLVGLLVLTGCVSLEKLKHNHRRDPIFSIADIR